MGLFRRRKRARAATPTDERSAPPAPTPARPASPTAIAPVTPSPSTTADTALPDPAERADPGAAFEFLIEREWARLAAPGAWWSGGERVAIAADARRAIAGEPLSGILPVTVAEATRRVAVEPAGIRGTDVARWELEGLDAFAYLEIVGIVSRLAALETAAYGLHRKLPVLPEPRAGRPSRDRVPGAAITTGWAPTVGPATAVNPLSAVPSEADAAADVVRVLGPASHDAIDPRQFALIAARTSWLNGCHHLLLRHTAALATGPRAAVPARRLRPIVLGIGETGVHHGAALLAFVDSVVLHDDEELEVARAALADRIGDPATEAVAMLVGCVSMNNRAVDAVGAPVGRDLMAIADDLGIAVAPHLAPR